MVEMGSDKASPTSTSAVPSLEFTTLASSLDKDYDKLEGNKHLLNRKTDRLTKKSSIGNKALLPQQVRVRLNTGNASRNNVPNKTTLLVGTFVCAVLGKLLRSTFCVPDTVYFRCS